MQNHSSTACNSVLNVRSPPQGAVVGGGVSGLSCTRELRLCGCSPIVFEVNDRLGRRCSSRSTRVVRFGDGVRCIGGATPPSVHVAPAPGELGALHPWTVAATPAEKQRKTKAWKKDEDETDVGRTLKLMGAVGVPSMVALAHVLARPLHVRLKTRIVQARRRGNRWALSSSAGEIEQDFQARVLAIPAPLAMALLRESSQWTSAVLAVRYRSRWVLLLGSERPVPLPGYREFQGSRSGRVAAMHSKPGRLARGPQRGLVEADARRSLRYAHEDAETIAGLLLDISRAYAGRPATPNFLQAYEWRHAFVEMPSTTPRRTECLRDDEVALGVCDDSVVTSQVGRNHRSGIDMARAVAERLNYRSGRSGLSAVDQDHGQLSEAYL